MKRITWVGLLALACGSDFAASRGGDASAGRTTSDDGSVAGGAGGGAVHMAGGRAALPREDAGGAATGSTSSSGGRMGSGGRTTTTGGETSSGGQVSVRDAGVDAGDGGHVPSSGGAGGAAGSSSSGGEPSHDAASCTHFDATVTFLPKRCQTIQNHGCAAGGTCISLEQIYCPMTPCVSAQEEDLCMPTGVTTSCASGCLEAFTCACLEADPTFDRSRLGFPWMCCDTPKGPSFVMRPLTCTES
jgi:hypothetical protein